LVVDEGNRRDTSMGGIEVGRGQLAVVGDFRTAVRHVTWPEDLNQLLPPDLAA
jgi:hypothetical protein